MTTGAGEADGIGAGVVVGEVGVTDPHAAKNTQVGTNAGITDVGRIEHLRNGVIRARQQRLCLSNS